MASSRKAADLGWLQRLRQLLNLQPVEAVGGSRGPAQSRLCLLSPAGIAAAPGQRPDAEPSSAGVLLVPLAAPMLVASQPLSEIVLEENGAVLWQALASSRQPLSSVRPWPIAPIKPGQELSLKLRAEGAGGSDYVLFRLRLADGPTLAKAQVLQQALAVDPSAWQRLLQRAAANGDRDGAAVLLSSPQPWQQQRQQRPLDPQQLCAGS